MSTRPNTSTPRPDRSKRRLHVVGVILSAVTAVAALAAVNSASVGASSTPAIDDPSIAVHRAALGEAGEGAIDTLRYHAPELTDSVWCDAMIAHDGDWDGFAAKIVTAADNWSSSVDGMFEFVGVVVQSVCPDTAEAFLASTVDS